MLYLKISKAKAPGVGNVLGLGGLEFSQSRPSPYPSFWLHLVLRTSLQSLLQRRNRDLGIAKIHFTNTCKYMETSLVSVISCHIYFFREKRQSLKVMKSYHRNAIVFPGLERGTDALANPLNSSSPRRRFSWRMLHVS